MKNVVVTQTTKTARPQDLSFSAKALLKAFPDTKKYSILAAFDAAEADDRKHETR